MVLRMCIIWYMYLYMLQYSQVRCRLHGPWCDVLDEAQSSLRLLMRPRFSLGTTMSAGPSTLGSCIHSRKGRTLPLPAVLLRRVSLILALRSQLRVRRRLDRTRGLALPAHALNVLPDPAVDLRELRRADFRLEKLLQLDSGRSQLICEEDISQRMQVRSCAVDKPM